MIAGSRVGAILRIDSQWLRWSRRTQGGNQFNRTAQIRDGINIHSRHYRGFLRIFLWHEQVPAAGTANFDAHIQSQRAALSLNGGTVYIPFGGRYGDCGSYHGWVAGAAVARAGPGATTTFILPTPNAGDHEGGFWAPSGAAIDGSNR